MTEFVGGCLCGQVRYTASGEILRVLNCHCSDCRKATGSAFATNIAMRRRDVVVTQGQTRQFNHVSDAGNNKAKEFCGTCGTQLFSSTVGAEVMTIKVGSVDDASFVDPSADIFTDGALAFVLRKTDLPRFPRMPEGGKS